MIVQACLDGARAPDYHPRLPVSTQALVADGWAAVKAGAAELHLHVRGPDGRESLAPEHVDATITALRERLPGPSSASARARGSSGTTTAGWP